MLKIFEPQSNLLDSFLFNSSRFLKQETPLALAAARKIIRNSSMALVFNLVGQFIDFKDYTLLT